MKQIAKEVIKKVLPYPFVHFMCLKRDAYRKRKRFKMEFGISKRRKSDSTFYCPCCKTYAKKPKEFWCFTHDTTKYDIYRYIGTRQDLGCPNCGSLPRHRILVYWMDHNMELLKNARILHFAREQYVYKWLNEHNIESVSADLFNEAELKLDMQDTKLAEGEFNFIIANHVLEHVPDLQKAIGEMYRILPKGGIFICSFPILEEYEHTFEDASVTEPEDRIKNFGRVDHYRIFGRDAKQELEKSGFSVSVIDGDDMPDEIAPFIGPADYDSNKLFLCKKM